ncbi:toprim domain-containing protein [Streptomyces sp. NBC_01433]|uniref:toprim domain-containing protein n=1 Tax=Streptomyces sp. NBC_01433 TaxID=2903864 RepID=UPI00225AAFD3|nr:toprim domain-containing protein [Streptomyces sp. NBC_01433]MCX4681589.1 toprim domain-containing protein [Streptomyces sp. NBC_01433]
MPAAPGQGPGQLDQEGHLAALMDVADRAFQDATVADDGALRAVLRSSARTEERLEAVMHATRAHWRDAERHYGLAREALAEGQKSRLEHHASQVIRAAVEVQRAAGVATSAEALNAVIEGLKPATEQARLAQARAQLEADLAELAAEHDRQLTAVTRMDEANRDQLHRHQFHAKEKVPELGWWPALATDMAHALEDRLWLDETGAARLLKEPVGERITPGRKINAERVAMLRAAGFLVTDTETDTSTLLRPSLMGREALYLATLYPEGLYADARAAYEARNEQSRRPWMTNEDRKSAARRLPPLSRYEMQAVREKPVLLDEDQVPPISAEDAARHAEEAQLAQRFARWVAMIRGELPDAPQDPRTAQGQSTEAVDSTVGQDAPTGEVHADEQPLTEMSPTTSDDDSLPVGPSEDTTTPDEEPEGAMGSRAADGTSPRLLLAETGDESPETEGWSGDAPSALAATLTPAVWADDQVPAALAESPGPQEESTPSSTAQPSPADESRNASPATESAGSSTEDDGSSSEPDAETRWRKRLASNEAVGASLGINPGAGESYEGYAGRFDGDYDITLPSGRYCYRAPGFDRKKYSVRYMPDPTFETNSKRIGAVSDPSEIMPMIRRHAARHADKRDPLAVELNEHEQKALDDVARGVISRSRGEWYRHNAQGIATQQTYDWTTHALWTLSALGLIQVPPVGPDRPKAFAALTEVGEQRLGLRGAPVAAGPRPDTQEQTALFDEPISPTAPEPDGQAAKAAESQSSTEEAQPVLPRFSRERLSALGDIARGTISVVDGEFMLTNPRRPTRQAPSQSHLRMVLNEGLAEVAGGQVHLSERGLAWYAHHDATLPNVPPDIETVDRAPLPPIDYTPTSALPAPEPSGEAPLPPAPAPLPAAWHRRGGRPSEESIEATYAGADRAAARASRSTARNVADFAAGPDHTFWTYQHPLAQYDENAAAALEHVADPVTREYATRAVLNLRAALVEAGEDATDYYVQNVRNPLWKTTMGVQADDVHRGRVSGTVVTYLRSVAEHAEHHGLDAVTIVNTLEDAAGWAGELRALGNADMEYPRLPAAENVAEAAQYVANALRAYALGQTDTVDTVAGRREAWRTVEPRPATSAPTGPAPEGPRARPATDQETPGAGTSTAPAPPPTFPRLAQARRRALVDIAYGNLSEVDGVFMKRTPQLTVERAYSQHAVTEVIEHGLAERSGQQIHITEYGSAWLAHHNIKLTSGSQQNPAAPGKTTAPQIDAHAPAAPPAAAAAPSTPQPAATASTAPAVTEPPAPTDADQAQTDVQAPPSLDGAEDAATGPTPAEDSAGAVEAGATAPTSADDQNRAAQAADRTNSARDQVTQAPTRAAGPALSQPEELSPSQGPAEAPSADQPIPMVPASEAPQPQLPDMPTSRPPAATGNPLADPRPITDSRAQGNVAPATAIRSASTPTPAEQGGGLPQAGSAAPVPEATTAASSSPPGPASPGPTGPSRSPATAREESPMATNGPSNQAPANTATSSGQTAVRPQQSASEAAAYADAAAYTTAHEALLTELDQHELWLAHTPAAAAAAASLDNTRTLGIPGLTALLALQRALPPVAGDRTQLTGLTQLLGHHIRCAQLSLAKAFFGQAARASSKDALRRLYDGAREGRFLDLSQQTQDGEMELGHYLHHRSQQIPPQPAGTEGPAEVVEEATAMAADHDDDSQMPVFERPGEVLLSAGQAAPRLHAHAQSYLVNGTTDIVLLAHIHGRPVYAMVAEEPGSGSALYLGLALRGEEANARTVHIGAEQLAQVTPNELLAAVTEWMNASDGGDRPLLDYRPSATPRSTAGPASVQGQMAPAEVKEPARAAAPDGSAAVNTDTTTAPQDTADETDEPQATPVAAQTPASEAAPAVKAAPDAEPEKNAPDTAATPAQEAQPPTVPGAATGEKQAAPPTVTAAAALRTDSATAEQESRAQGTTQQGVSPAAPTKAPAPGTVAPVEQLTALARSALTGLGVTLEATGVLTADRTVVITLETSGTAERDREIAGNLRPALHKAIREHPDQSLAAYRVDFQHTPQAGQGALQEAPGSTTMPVPRERLIAANTAAAKIFTDQLQSDPSGQLARTYLTEKRQLPSAVQQEWGLGYAPSDTRAGRWDVVVRALRDQGFTEEELLQAGLAKRSQRDTLIDPFRDRLMFPIHDKQGDIVGFSGRRIDRPGESEAQAKDRGGPKYLNTSNDATLFSKGDLVFGLHHPAQARALASSNGPRVSVEGYFDVIAVARATASVSLDQRPVVGAPMGTAFTQPQLTLLRGLDTDTPHSHIVFLDADDSGRKVLLDKWELLLQADGETTVTSAPDSKDAAKLWEDGITADGDGATPVMQVLEARQPLLDAAVEAVLVKNADEGERANHTFAPTNYHSRTKNIATQAARYIHQWVQARTPGDTAALEQAALTWAKRLDQDWGIPGHLTATAVLLGPGTHHEDYENEVYQQALDLLAADPDDYFANDSHVAGRQSAADSASATAPSSPSGTGRTAARTGQWPTGTRASGPLTPTSTPIAEPAAAGADLALNMVLPSAVDGQPVKHTDRTTAAYALQIAVHERLGQHTAESPEPDRLPQPLKLGTVYGVDLSTSGDDQTSDDPTVVVWLGTSRNDSLRMSYSRFVKMTGPELLAAVEWRAAQSAGLLGAPLSQTWRNAVRSILPTQFPAQPTPAQLADLLDTIAQGPDAETDETRHHAEQALAAYTAGHPDLALNVLATDDHIWVLRNDDGTWIQEEAPGTPVSWKEVDSTVDREAVELQDIAGTAAELPGGDPAPMPADLTVAHHSAHEALAALRPYSIGLPNTRYEKITDLVAQMDTTVPALRRLHGPDGEQLMNRARSSFIRIVEGLATVASKIHLNGLSARLERTVAHLRGQDTDSLPVPRVVRTDRRMQDLAHIERDLERRMAAPTTLLEERGELQEQWIINRARWRARYEQLHGQAPDAEFLPDNGLVAGAPPVPNLIAAHDLLVERLSSRVVELRDVDPHTGEESNPYEPTADLFNGVAWAYQQRLVGIIPTGQDPEGPILPAQLRNAALTVTSHQQASPLTLRRAMNVTAERADRLLHRLEEQQILGPYRADAPRTVLARPTDIDTLLARPAIPRAVRTPPATSTSEPAPNAKGAGPDAAESEGPGTGDLEARITELVTKLFADQQKRNETRAEPAPADVAAPASRVRKNLRKTQEAENNALAAGQTTSLAPSQS